VVFLADNGWITRPDSPDYAPRSKQSPYDGGLRTPLIIRWPKKVRPEISSAAVSSIDIAPTLLEAVGLSRVSGQQGVNLLNAAEVKVRKAIHGECFTHNAVRMENPQANLRFRWIIEGQWKLIDPGLNEQTAPVELFDILADPQEKTDLSSKNPEQVEVLRKRLDHWWPVGK